jgi:polyisoprenyl-teichoic acid--peptidoglycan teichoic acid transferase
MRLSASESMTCPGMTREQPALSNIMEHETKLPNWKAKRRQRLQQNLPYVSPKKKTFPKGKILLVLLGVFVIFFLIKSFSSSPGIVNPHFKLPFQKSAVNSTDDRVNILLLGNGGGKHDGAQLTDSIIVASYNLKTKKVVLISIPRDLWLDKPKLKINALYEKGDEDRLRFAEDKIDDILGIPIHYGIRLDFAGFAKAVDTVGGVDVNVERTFDDYMYPIEGKENDLCDNKEETVTLNEDQIKALNLPPDQKDFKPNVAKKVIIDPSGKIATDSGKIDFNCRFEHIHYDKGINHLDGTTALKYVRSRHALGPEGSDFARSKRQQRVIEAFREKALSLETLVNPGKITSLISAFGQSFETDIPPTAYLELYNMFKNIAKTDSIVLGQLDDGTSLLINPPPSDYGGAWVLIPPKNDFTQIQQYLGQKITEAEQTATPSAKIK